MNEDDLIFELVQAELLQEESKTPETENIVTDQANITVLLKDDIRAVLEQDVRSLKVKMSKSQLPL